MRREAKAANTVSENVYVSQFSALSLITDEPDFFDGNSVEFA